MTIASPAVFTLTAHGLVANDIVYLTTTGALPTGLAINTPYYVIATGLTANSFQVSATQGGAAINSSGTQSGTHSLWMDKSTAIEWPSIKKMDVLTKEPDRLEFRIKNYATKTYRPALSDEVLLYDGTTKIFGGNVVESHETHDGLLKYYIVVCTDYQRLMDQKLVNKTYVGQTIGAIIADFVANYLPAGFTTTHVNGLSVIDKMVFNDEAPSKCIQRMADYVGTHDWYVDYDKDIHFFPEGSEPAPFNLDDTGGKYIFGSLSLDKNINQLRNTVIVSGGDKQSTTLTDTKTADGTQKTFVAKPGLQNLTIERDSGSGFVTQTIGTDGKDDPLTKDCLYNTDNGFIIFPTTLTASHKVRWSGVQVYPIKIIRRNIASIALYGEWQYIIRDATIKSEITAKQRAGAEITKYGDPANEGVFRTYSSGLRSGMSITVQSTALGISTLTFKIVRCILTARTNSAFEYEVHLLASEDVGIIDVLSKLLVSDPAAQFVTSESTLIVQSEAWDETVTYTENFTVNPFGLNVKPTPVCGPYHGTGSGDLKRVLCLSGNFKLL
jgi:hypothetical protein